MNGVPTTLQQALRLFATGSFAAAEPLFLRLVTAQPQELTAYLGYAECLRASKKAQRAIVFLQQAAPRFPDSADLALALGLAWLDEQQYSEAASMFKRALQLDAGSFVARLHLAIAYERLGEHQQAIALYFRAVVDAQLQGHWLNDKTTPPWLRSRVQYALEMAFAGRKQLLFDVLNPLVARFGAGELERVKACLSNYLGLLKLSSGDPRQKPSFLYFPGLPATPYFDMALFPWREAFEAKTESIQREMEQVLNRGEGVEAFHQHAAASELGHLVQGKHGQSAWNAFFFYRNGETFVDNVAKCPATFAALNELPMVKIRAHAPEACFSIIEPGGHIMPHRGVTNTRLVLHLPLRVPVNCALNITGVGEHHWQPGRAMVFDDTYEHEAWNRSDAIRVILLTDIWNPYLTEVERLAITALVETIGDFNEQGRR